MSVYNPQDIEAKWQKTWQEKQAYRVTENTEKPKYYVLDMFPYPSGAGLHVGHPLGYIASDIIARYKRHKGFNVLHPMGYDSFGLPAEQYAMQTGQHPAVTTDNNIERYRKQLDQIGFSFDWSRELRTSDPEYYRWTQWIFKLLFNSWYNNASKKAEKIETLITAFETDGNANVKAVCDEIEVFTAAQWAAFNEQEKEAVLQNYRIAYLADTWVNWCEGLGTVLANDEIKDGVSERGGHPVVQKKMRQWNMRITAYADRLLNSLDSLEWDESIKEIQRNWIGKSKGANVQFALENSPEKIEVFTTRPDTIFGVSFMVLAPEHPLVDSITTSAQKEVIAAYVAKAALRSERDRQSDTKTVTGAFTGAYAIHPFTQKPIPVWIGDYVLASYGTGAVMAVPAGDQRDYNFAKAFDIEIPEILEAVDIENGAVADKNIPLKNSDFLDGLKGKNAIQLAITKLEELNAGKGKTIYRLRNAVFSRQRYWGEPFPVYYENDVPKIFPDSAFAKLPPVDKYLPTEDGEPPLARAKKEDWNVSMGDRMEYNTMPGWAGSSWYFARYVDPANSEVFADADKLAYWQNVDLYIGGAEHATGHLLYSRFWTKFLFDMGYLPYEEPFKKMINQGMILGRSNLVYQDKNTKKFVSKGLLANYDTTPIHVDINFVENDILNIEAFKAWRPEFANAEFILESNVYHCGFEVEKMSKSKFNVQTPDDLVEKYGADTLRMYEMFLGPLEQHKPWDTKGINGVSGFLRKFWRLFHPEETFAVSKEEPTKEELKTLHKTIKKVNEEVERYSFNTVISAFMIAVNELQDAKCNKQAILEPLVVLLAPFAPHIAEELWNKLGHTNLVLDAAYPLHDDKYLTESTVKYPVSFNGKTRFLLELDKSLNKDAVEAEVLANENTKKYLDNQAPKKIIVVPGKIVNIVM